MSLEQVTLSCCETNLHRSCISAGLVSEALTELCLQLPFQEYLYSKQSLKIEIVSPAGAKSPHAYSTLLKIPKAHYSSSIKQSTACADII